MRLLVSILLSSAVRAGLSASVAHVHTPGDPDADADDRPPTLHSWRQQPPRPRLRNLGKRRASRHYGRMGMANVTCMYHAQPLDHFSAPARRASRSKASGRGEGESFQQRYCIYGGYDPTYNHRLASPPGAAAVTEDNEKEETTEDDCDCSTNPIFFYAGNESPVDQYVNQTGLMWELAPKHSALVIFAEHRYQGLSVPDLTVYNDPARTGSYDGCFTHLTSSQALADYAALLSHLNPSHSRPVVVFGGSYGGMLAAWMRMVYPGTVAGAVAASAPIWGLPLTQEARGTGRRVVCAAGIGGAARVVGRAVRLPYPPNAGGSGNEEEGESQSSRCFDNLLAIWPLISYFGLTDQGRSVLTETFRLCNPVRTTEDVVALLDWAQSPWFDMAEGDFPYASSYIPFALGMGNVDLPAWPLQYACHSSGLDEDWGITYDPPPPLTDDAEKEEEDTRPDVKYTIRYGPDGPVLDVDWDEVTVRDAGRAADDSFVRALFNATMEAVAVWFNVSGAADCFDATPAINEEGSGSSNARGDTFKDVREQAAHAARTLRTPGVSGDGPKPTPAELCQEKLDKETVWTSLVCNEDMNLVITVARGMGGDFFWPPTYPRGTETYRDVLATGADPYGGACDDPNGIYGYPPRSAADPWATWLDDYYGGSRIGSRSNIVFSNGMLDPWSAAGAYAAGGYPVWKISDRVVDSRKPPTEQNITADGTVVSILLDLGGHHLDLMYSHKDDPPCASAARTVEDDHIGKWISEWRDGTQQLPACLI